jgi:uncharacterized protein YndB with AHSA1/START domain
MTRPDSTPQQSTEVVAQRDLDLPPGVVWPALVDPDLLAGWLGEVVIDGDLMFVLRAPRGAVIEGRIAELVEAERLRVQTDRGRVVLRLEERSGGLRDTWTRLVVEAAASVGPLERWNEALDRLEELLHGRPTDWREVPTATARRAAR